jgi:5-methylthioadenosine/S-adenosylhomocysteine deaminase
MRHLLLSIVVVCCLATFALAQTTIYDIQYTTDPSGDSPLVGQTVTTGGVVTAVQYDGFVMYEADGPWHAVFVYNFSAAPALGDEVTVTGLVQEYYGMTEISDITAFNIVSHGNPVTPLVVPVAAVSQEQYESVLLTVENVTVTALLTFGEWTLDGVLFANDTNDYLYFPQIGDELTGITGTLFFNFGAFKLEPRFTNDITGDLIAHYALGGDVVTMNESRDVLIGHWVEVLGDEIVAIHASEPAGIPTVNTGGLIFPGLIDAHNHPVYNVLGPIPFDQLFEHRDEWRSDPLYDDFNAQRNAIMDNPNYDTQSRNVNKLAEVRAMTAGTATIQGPNSYGHSYDDYARQGIGINNAHRMPPRIYHSTFPLSDSIAEWQARASDNWRRFVVHVAEGTNQLALDEFAQWEARMTLDERTTIIHGTALGATEWSALGSAGSNLVWSPQSNIALYGTTTDIPGALAAGVTVALAPDWTESGANELLSEMKIARDWSDSEWGGILTSQILVEMATCNAAAALGMSDIRGAIVPGLRADLMVIPGNAAAPYDALMAAYPADVAMTVISGRPGYGDPALVDQFTGLTLVEDIEIDSVTKRLALAITSHSIDNSDEAFSSIMTTLETAYAAAPQEPCCFRGLEVRLCDATAVPELGSTLVTLAAHPNPFNPRATVAFALHQQAHVNLEVFDVSGRRVAMLAVGEFAAGNHTVTWEGRDQRGRAQSSGTYLMRLTAGTTTLTEKVVLVR